MTNFIRRAASTIVAGAVVGGCLAAFTPSRSAAQSTTSSTDTTSEIEPSSPPPALRQNRRRLNINRTGMLTLLGWSAANIGVGSYGWATSENDRARYFHQMNVAWNGVNAVIGSIGYVQAISEDPRGLSEIETIEKTRQMQQILLFNAGLDVAYMAGGAWLRARGDAKDDPQLSGYGDSLILQGGFLFVFDLVLWGVHQHAISDFKATIAPTWQNGPGARLSVNF